MWCCIVMLYHLGYALPWLDVYGRQDEKAGTWNGLPSGAYCSGIPLEYNAECYELIEAVAPAASLRADYGRSLSRLQRRLTALNQFFDFLLPLPDLDIARDVNQLQVHLVEDRSGTVAFIH